MKSIIGDIKLKFIHDAIIETNNIEGDVAECGVFRGGSAYVICNAVSAGKKVHLFDSWEGLPQPSDKDTMIWKEGAFRCSFEECKKSLKEFEDKIIYHKGFFCDTIPLLSDEKFTVVHLDCDFYQSYIDALTYMVPRIVDGGFLICDEKIHVGAKGKYNSKAKIGELTGFGKALYEYFGGIDHIDHDGREYGITIRIKK